MPSAAGGPYHSRSPIARQQQGISSDIITNIGQILLMAATPSPHPPRIMVANE